VDVGAVSQSRGYKAALDARVAHAYDELCAVARRLMARERAAHPLGAAAALVHEAYVRLFEQRNLDPADRCRFLAAAATTMRRILVDQAKHRRAAKRGGVGWRRAVGDADDLPHAAPAPDGAVKRMALADALAKLARVNPRAAAVVSLHCLAGRSVRDVAGALHLAPRTVRQDCATARAWLRRELDA
jgi:RNA polymerase sigma factor (TIGR02999 family)